MSKPNGRQQKAIEGLAAALNECFDANIEVAERRFEEKWGPRFDRQDDTLRMSGRSAVERPTSTCPSTTDRRSRHADTQLQQPVTASRN